MELFNPMKAPVYASSFFANSRLVVRCAVPCAVTVFLTSCMMTGIRIDSVSFHYFA
jgi:hypothetical protein